MLIRSWEHVDPCDHLCEVDLSRCATAMTARMAAFVDEGLRRAKKVDCFDFVPSNAEMLHAALSILPRGRFCEWGSGIGIGVGIAEMLGLRAVGFEINEPLAEASRRLFRDFDLRSDIVTGSFFDIDCEAETYFVYGWPSQMREIRSRYVSLARPESSLLICHGADDLRCEQWIPPNECVFAEAP